MATRRSRGAAKRASAKPKSRRTAKKVAPKRAAKNADPKRAPQAAAPPAAPARPHKSRRQPESLRLRSFSPGFTVADLSKSVDFYTRTLGFIVAERWVREGALRGVMLKGWYPSEALTQLLILAALGMVFAVIAVRRYGDTLE